MANKQIIQRGRIRRCLICGNNLIFARRQGRIQASKETYCRISAIDICFSHL